MSSQVNEQTRLLNGQNQHDGYTGGEDEAEEVDFAEHDEANPREWSNQWKYTQVMVIFFIGVNGPMASSMFAPAIGTMAKEWNVDEKLVILGQSVFVWMLGLGPLFLAPMSETFGRRILFIINVFGFTITQILTTFSPNVAIFIILRLIGGFFGSVGVANGGGTLTDMFPTGERAKMFGFYMLGPLLGPSLGPFLGGLCLEYLTFRWISGIMSIIGAVIATASYFFLHESNSVTILEERKKEYKKQNPNKKYIVHGGSDASIFQKIRANSSRAAKILLSQPIVLTLSIYQALIFATMYSLYTSYSSIWTKSPYFFNAVQVAIAYLGPPIGFTVTACIAVPYTDAIYNFSAKRNNDSEGMPEYRLPFSYPGAVALPIALFWFAWAAEEGAPWPAAFAATILFGASQVSLFNGVNNYIIDAFESQAASALAAGAVFRSLIGGVTPLFIPSLFGAIGFGWGISIFAILGVILMPAPPLFYKYGPILRKKFAVQL